MRNRISFIIVTSLIFLLTGCFGAKEIEGETYVTAMGLDYEEGNFKVYIQGLSFGNIAKQEAAAVEQQPILIGEAKGETFTAALGVLEQMTDMPINYGHIQTIILSKSVMKEKMEDVMGLIKHSPLLRYNFYLFGTDENLKSLMQMESFFNFPQLYTVIHRSDKIIQYNYVLPNMIYNRFISQYFRPVGTIFIPSLTIDKNHFSEKKEKPTSVINGEYVFSRQQFRGWLSKDELSGLKWFKKGIQGVTLRVGTENVSVRVKNPKIKIMVLKGKTPSYKVVVKGDAVLTQERKKLKLKEVENEINKKIKKDILHTIKKGQLLETDVLNISEKSYKYYLNHWNIDTIKRFNEDSVKQIQVMIRVDPGNTKN
ncbi:Ger(x)C family spore germination protein [Neobacillus niacini]|uniref:Ger(x)C family spore germination protein n=1 Tax=Neobacillus niacini TaxID=86668 RepID=UPI002FFE125E